MNSLKSPQIRFFSHLENSNNLTHVDEKGKATMVDVSSKSSSLREATAVATVEVGQEISKLIKENNMKKGDVLTVSQLAGIMGAKKTSDLIPLCHNIPLSSVKVKAELDFANHSVQIIGTVRCFGQTGVEMEALTAVSLAALCVYDMCKAISHNIIIKNIRLMQKSGGKRDFQCKM